MKDKKEWTLDEKFRLRRVGESTVKTTNLFCGICGQNEFFIDGGKYGSLECKNCGAGVEDNIGYGFYTSWQGNPDSGVEGTDNIKYDIYTGLPI